MNTNINITKYTYISIGYILPTIRKNICQLESSCEPFGCRVGECTLGRVEKSKNGFGLNGYCYFNVFWYVENWGNFCSSFFLIGGISLENLDGSIIGQKKLS